MKKIVGYIIVIILIACNNRQRVTTSGRDTTIYFPYSPTYSELENGKPILAKKVLEVWRAYETGNITSASKNFADSIKLIFQDEIFTGKRDEVLNSFQKRRNAYTDVQAYVDSWLPVHAKETNKNMVFVWGRLDCRDKNRSRDYLVIHQIWWFNASEEITEMDEYRTHPH